MSNYNESHLEVTTLEWLHNLGYQIIYGNDIAPDSSTPARASYGDVLLVHRLRDALVKINPKAPTEAIDETVKKISTLTGTKLVTTNKEFQKMLTDGVDIQIRKADGSVGTEKIRLIDKNNVHNDFVAVNQFTIVQGNYNRRPDIIIFVNGLPLVVLELKNMIDDKTDIKKAYNQIQNYKNQIEPLFYYNSFCVISDGLDAKMGTITSNWDRFMSWKSVDGKELWSKVRNLETMIHGVFEKSRFIDLILNYITFVTDGEETYKIMSAYHQFFAVQKAVESTTHAVTDKTKKVGVVWHTQWSWKSLTMVFYAWKVIQNLNNPTLLVITDRNDLDDQLFSTFSKSKDLLRQNPQQAKDRDDLRRLLSVASWGVVFTTIQKFTTEDGENEYPLLSDRSNIIVIADEAHRTQYGFKAKIDKNDGELSYGFAKYLRDWLPNASFIGFTGTPIEFTDKNTKAIFGDYIDVYDISQAVEDGATVPIYYEARLAKINLKEEERPLLDWKLEEVTEWEEMNQKEKLKSRWARLEAMVGTDKRLSLVAKDIINHFENRQSVMDGKAMIVCMSRRICVDLYNKIIELRPQWHNDDEKKGMIKVVMTWSSADPEKFQPHVRNKQQRDALALRMKDTKDELKLVIVRDMWLTGFDVPCMHTMYLDKPMQGHGLMQAIARVNRVYKDKQAWLIVDYLGIATQLKEALSYYTQDGNKKDATIPQEQAIAVMHEKYEVVKNMYHGFAYEHYLKASPTEKTEILSSAMEFILNMERDSDESKKRYIKAVTELTYAFSIAMPSDEALRIREDIAFFQAIKAGLTKFEVNEDGKKSESDYEDAIKQIVSWAVTSNEVIDVFKVAGIDKPDISILSNEFLEEVKGMKHQNLAFELLRKLLNDNIRSLTRKNLVKSRSFADMLEATIKKYQNRTIESAEIIAELIELAKKIQAETQKGNDLWLTDEELAFYDALANNESAVKELWDETLRDMARELFKLVKENTSIDWTMKADVQAKLRVYIKRLLKKYKYPPDFEEQATETILKQAELSSEGVVNEI